ncbi:hypothetical protein [Elioraea sp.]|uniref:hypothetical protein n=1 Tax=Elioraea sp. TaxID=2185103 RepID=UPI0025BA776B|nr:hypothetical protein [Elioraea sp.]
MNHRAAVIVRDSVTELDASARGAVVLAASHGGRYAAWCAAKAGVGAVILSDAGIGRNRAGVAGLGALAALGVPAATVDIWSARIGDGADCLSRGVLSTINPPAEALGIRIGMRAADALGMLASAGLQPSPTPAALAESRQVIAAASVPPVQVIALDSTSLVRAEDAGHVVVTGSHGGVLGGRAGTAVSHPVFAALYNDAGMGIDGAGTSRLPALDLRGIAAATVAADSAEIGDGMSTWREGIISAVNDTARRNGGAVGQSARALVAALVAAGLRPGSR